MNGLLMSNKTIKPFGAWESPITTDLMVSNTVGLGEIQLQNGNLYWIEMRPEEKGRYVVVQLQTGGSVSDCIPEPMNARTRVHEYGGGSYLATNDAIYFCHFNDQQLYCIQRDKQAVCLTDDVHSRYADFVLDTKRQRLISVMETHQNENDEAKNCIVSISINPQNKQTRILVEGDDFYSNPRVSPNGRQLTWVSWNHPNMPWDDSELWLAEIDEKGELYNQHCISDGVNESVFQPEWSPDGVLYFVSDRNGWWNLYCLKDEAIQNVIEMEAEFGVAQWSFRESTYTFSDKDTIICTYTKNGINHLASINLRTKILNDIPLPYTDIEGIQADSHQAVFLAASPDDFPQIVRMDLQTNEISILKRSSELDLEQEFISIGKAIEFPTEDGRDAHAFFYAPNNFNYCAPENELPPLMVFSHGGPTGMSRNGLKIVIQYFTSRGFAVLDVNYGGSSGYGRDYRKRLNGQWGIVDVDDCVNSALYLAEKNQVDRERLAIRGGSAGGFTTLAALTFRDVFKAGCSRYGVSDLEALAKETHKFESRYLDSLLGPYPEQIDVYKARSPIHSADELSCPVIFFQGLEDKIVLPNQAEMMVEALLKNGLPVAYIPFAGEQHGFRQAENIKKALDGELYFFSRVFDFEPADNIEAIDIRNSELL